MKFRKKQLDVWNKLENHRCNLESMDIVSFSKDSFRTRCNECSRYFTFTNRGVDLFLGNETEISILMVKFMRPKAYEKVCAWQKQIKKHEKELQNLSKEN